VPYTTKEADLAAAKARMKMNYAVANHPQFAGNPIVAAALANAKASDAAFFSALAEVEAERSFLRMWRTHRHFRQVCAAADQAHEALRVAVTISEISAPDALERKAKFKELLGELQVEIVAETLRISQGVKSAFDEVPPLKIGESEQMTLVLGVLSFFLHVLDRDLFRPDSEILRENIYDPTAEALSHWYGKALVGSDGARVARRSIDHRTLQLAKAPSVLGKDSQDRNSVLWRAARAIGEEDLGRTDPFLFAVILLNLTRGLNNLPIEQRAKALAELL
jgi:hypothetical protein